MHSRVQLCWWQPCDCTSSPIWPIKHLPQQLSLRWPTLRLSRQNAYRLTSLSDHFLVEGKPGYLGGDTLAMLDYLPAWFELDRTVRTSQPYRDLGDASTAEAFFAPRVRDLFPLVHP